MCNNINVRPFLQLMTSSNHECKTGFIWNPVLETFDFGSSHPVRVGRFQMIRNFVEETGFLSRPNVSVIPPRPMSIELLEQTHSLEYIQTVKYISQTGVGDIAIDTPGYSGIFENALITCGTTITGVDAVMTGEINHFLSPTGGFHHAEYDSGGGFCIFNDVAAAVYRLKEYGLKRILVADFDVHHGNGTQKYFYHDPQVMTLSFHEDPDWLYPHDGHIQDIGADAGKGYNINIPLPIDSGDAVYKYAFDAIVPPVVNAFKPEFILFLPGFDAHYRDPLAQLILTTGMIRYVTEWIHQAAHMWSAGRLGVISGGGYDPDAFKWGIGEVMSVLTGHTFVSPKQTPPFEDDEENWEFVRRVVGHLKELVFPILNIPQ